MVTRTGFEPVNAAVKGRCVKPLHQRATVLLYISTELEFVQQFFILLVLQAGYASALSVQYTRSGYL